MRRSLLLLPAFSTFFFRIRKLVLHVCHAREKAKGRIAVELEQHRITFMEIYSVKQLLEFSNTILPTLVCNVKGTDHALKGL